MKTVAKHRCIALAASLVLAGITADSHAALALGDLAIVRVNNGTDGFSVVALRALSGEDLHWTDDGWKSDNTFRTGENNGVANIAPASVAAGSVFDVSAATMFAAAGDQCFLFTGTIAAPSLLYGVNWGNASGWTATAADSNTSANPAVLSGNTPPLSLQLGTSAAYHYNGTLTGSATDLLTAISNPANWAAVTGSPATSWSRGAFSVSGGAKTLTWNTAGATWNQVAANTPWKDSANADQPFTNGDNVNFTDTGAGVVIVAAGGVTPGSVAITNTVQYSFSGGPINGGTSIVKSGAGTLALTSDNGYSGGTTINDGIVEIGADTRLGNTAGSLTLGGGTLRTTAPFTIARNVIFAAGGGTMDTNGNDITLGATTSGAGGMTKSSGGILTLSSNLGYSGVTAILGGSVILDAAGNPTAALSAAPAGGTFVGNLILNKQMRINFNSGTFSGGGQIQVRAAGSSIALSGSSLTPIINNDILLNSAAAPQPFFTNIGATGGNTITIGGIISGDSDVNFAVSTSGGAGIVVLNRQNTWTGATTINASASGAVRLGIADALPPATALTFGTQAGAGPGSLDLFGHDQTVASLNFGGQGAAASAKINNNNGTADATFTVNGAGNFPGTFNDGPTNKLALVKDGAGTLTLSGINTHTGGTTVKAGLLSVTGSLAANGSAKVAITPGNLFSTSPTLTRSVALAASYSGMGSSILGDLGTAADIRAGANATGADITVSMQWRTRTAGEIAPGSVPPMSYADSGLVSDVLNLSGLSNDGSTSATDPYALQMTYSVAALAGIDEEGAAASDHIYLAWLNPAAGQWQHATAGDYRVITSFGSVNYRGTWDAFAAANGVTDANLGDFVGSYGVDTAAHTVWAVVDHESQFAVVPEPAAVGVLALAASAALVRRRRR